MSDMDLLGLVRYLRSNPQSAQADWHLQFHFSVFFGRDPDYPAQEGNVAALKRRMAGALDSIPKHRLHFYTTTDELGRQFNRLNVAPFETLPWPVGRQFQCDERAERTAPARLPLRVLCAGAVRREKGSDQLGSLSRALWDDLLQPRRAQLLFQLGNKRRWHQLTELPAGSFQQAASIDNLSDTPLVALPHPLQPEEYARLIKSADIGLLLYNADVYFARCSGILAELLAAGVPVIVPARGWLAEQFAEANQSYLAALAGRALATHPSPAQAAVLPVPLGSSDLIISVRTTEVLPPGSYLRVAVEQFDAAGRPLDRFAAIVGQTSVSHEPASALFHLATGCSSVRVEAAPAYGARAAQELSLSTAFLPAPSPHHAHWPAGKVGLTFAEPADIPRLLAEMVANHPHYQEAVRRLFPPVVARSRRGAHD